MPVATSATPSVMHTSPVCPGSANLLPSEDHEGHRYLRLMFTVYWMDASPQALDIYYTCKRIWFSCKGIQQLQSDVLALVSANVTDRECIDVVFGGYLGVHLDPDDVEALGWKVVVGTDTFSA